MDVLLQMLVMRIWGWKKLFADDFIKMFEFELVLSGIVDVMRRRIAQRLLSELNVDMQDLIK